MRPCVLVTGGSGYIGSCLVPALVERGWSVVSLDQEYFGRGTFAHPHLERVQGDIRSAATVDGLLGQRKFNAVIHLAAVSNDPGSELDAELTRQINRVACEQVMRSAQRHGVPRFLYASSASVYGLKSDPDVHEALPLEPLTLYARYKAEGEEVLAGLVSPSFVGVSVRSATVCGFSPRLRLDLTVNILTHQAITRRKLTVFGGAQMRPNIHVLDLVDFYLGLLDAPADRVNGQAFNVSCANASVMGLAQQTVAVVDPSIPIDVTPSNDNRSYSLSAAKAARVLDFHPRRTVKDAVVDLCEAYRTGRVPEPDHPRYRNVEWMKANLAQWTVGVVR